MKQNRPVRRLKTKGLNLVTGMRRDLARQLVKHLMRMGYGFAVKKPTKRTLYFGGNPDD